MGKVKGKLGRAPGQSRSRSKGARTPPPPPPPRGAGREGLEARVHGAFDYAAIGMALAAPDGRWLKVNQALCDIVGYSEREMLGLTYRDITHPDDQIGR